jgi:tetratricopeptide (TPR) repeat protein
LTFEAKPPAGKSALSSRQVYYAVSDYKRAAEIFQRNIELLQVGLEHPIPPYRIQSQGYLLVALSALGQFAEGQRHGEEALCLATAEGRGVEPMVAHWCLGRLFLVQGDLEAAISMLDRGLACCRAAALGYVSTLAGRITEGHALAEEGLRAPIRIGAPYAQSLLEGDDIPVQLWLLLAIKLPGIVAYAT